MINVVSDMDWFNEIGHPPKCCVAYGLVLNLQNTCMFFKAQNRSKHTNKSMNIDLKSSDATAIYVIMYVDKIE